MIIGDIIMALDACVRVQQAVAAGVAPNASDVEECERWKRILDTIKQFYLLRFFPPRIPLPLPGPITGIPGIGNSFGDPTPQPNIFSGQGIQDLLFAELFLDNLRRDPTPTPTIFSQIRESGAQIEIVKGLIEQFDEASKVLKIELENLEKCCCSEK